VNAALCGVALTGCSHPAETKASGTKPSAREEPPSPDWQDAPFDPDADQPDGQLASIFAPKGCETWPVLIALHGRGEAGRGLPAGAHGWRDDYAIDTIRARLEKQTLGADDVASMISEARLESMRASMSAMPYRGVVLVCPYTPVPTGTRSVEDAAPFGRFVEKRLLPRVAELRKFPVAPEATGIDGVSMGGRYALQLGFSMPHVFASVGALQPAIAVEEASRFAELAARASKQRGQKIRLATSEDDPFLDATRALSLELDARSIAHKLVVDSGPHDYSWNRGPGSAELLLFHERALRGASPP